MHADVKSYKGVSRILRRGKKGGETYRAHITILKKDEVGWENRQIHLGHFNTAAEAARAHDVYALALRRAKTTLNFPDNTYIAHDVEAAKIQLNKLPAPRVKTSQYLGVSTANPTGWRASFMNRYRYLDLGKYDKEEDAALQYDLAALAAAGGHVAAVKRLNFRSRWQSMTAADIRRSSARQLAMLIAAGLRQPQPEEQQVVQTQPASTVPHQEQQQLSTARTRKMGKEDSAPEPARPPFQNMPVVQPAAADVEHRPAKRRKHFVSHTSVPSASVATPGHDPPCTATPATSHKELQQQLFEARKARSQVRRTKASQQQQLAAAKTAIKLLKRQINAGSKLNCIADADKDAPAHLAQPQQQHPAPMPAGQAAELLPAKLLAAVFQPQPTAPTTVATPQHQRMPHCVKPQQQHVRQMADVSKKLQLAAVAKACSGTTAQHNTTSTTAADAPPAEATEASRQHQSATHALPAVVVLAQQRLVRANRRAELLHNIEQEEAAAQQELADAQHHLARAQADAAAAAASAAVGGGSRASCAARLVKWAATADGTGGSCAQQKAAPATQQQLQLRSPQAPTVQQVQPCQQQLLCNQHTASQLPHQLPASAAQPSPAKLQDTSITMSIPHGTSYDEQETRQAEPAAEKLLQQQAAQATCDAARAARKAARQQLKAAKKGLKALRQQIPAAETSVKSAKQLVAAADMQLAAAQQQWQLAVH